MYRHYFEVRDHECDIQGVVNNAHYLHYFEHARHTFLKQHEIHFDRLAQDNIYLMVKNSQIEYFKPLKAHDEFYITVKFRQHSRLLAEFSHEARLANDNSLISQVKTQVITVDSEFKILRKSPLKVLSSQT